MIEIKNNKAIALLKIKHIVYSVFYELFFTYSTVREVKYDIIRNRSYQSTDNVYSTVTTKVKGLAFVNNVTNQYIWNEDKILLDRDNQFRIFDTADYTLPAEYSSLFIMTNFVETLQSQGTCLEDEKKKQLHCKSGIDCVTEFEKSSIFSGLPTGRCNKTLSNRSNKEVGVCEIKGWCPVESQTNNNLLQNIEHFTIFIKNDIHFKKFDIKRTNLHPNMTNEYISNCKYDPSKDSNCPVFLVKDILEKAEPDPVERNQMLFKGGILEIEIEWNCNLDYSLEYCIPKYSFERYDLKFKTASSSSGFNFRYAERYEKENTKYRVLIKAYGLRFFIVVSGKAGKLGITDFVPLFITIGAGIGLLVFPTIVSDFILLYLSRKKKFYRDLKFYDYKKGNENIGLSSPNDTIRI